MQFSRQNSGRSVRREEETSPPHREPPRNLLGLSRPSYSMSHRTPRPWQQLPEMLRAQIAPEVYEQLLAQMVEDEPRGGGHQQAQATEDRHEGSTVSEVASERVEGGSERASEREPREAAGTQEAQEVIASQGSGSTVRSMESGPPSGAEPLPETEVAVSEGTPDLSTPSSMDTQWDRVYKRRAAEDLSKGIRFPFWMDNSPSQPGNSENDTGQVANSPTTKREGGTPPPQSEMEVDEWRMAGEAVDGDRKERMREQVGREADRTETDHLPDVSPPRTRTVWLSSQKKRGQRPRSSTTKKSSMDGGEPCRVGKPHLRHCWWAGK